MKRIFISFIIFIIAYGIAYCWGLWDLRANPPVIENDGDLATLGMMPIFLHVFGIACGIAAGIFYGFIVFINFLLLKSKSTPNSDDENL